MKKCKVLKEKEKKHYFYCENQTLGICQDYQNTQFNFSSYVYMHPHNHFIIGLMAQLDCKAFM